MASVRGLLVLLTLGCLLVDVTPKKKTHHFGSLYNSNFMNDDPLLGVEPVRPQAVVQGMCTCECCPNEPPAKLELPGLDLVLAVDSSACFRDQHSRMIRYLTKLVKRISRDDELTFGADNIRLALMQFSDQIKFPIEFDAFKSYTEGTNREITSKINRALNNLGFIGQGAYLDKALNQSMNALNEEPSERKKVIITLTNGKSHPDVTTDDIENSINGLRVSDISVIPVSVTRRCHLPSEASWNDNLCPDVTVMTKLARVNRENRDFLTMKDQESMMEIVEELKAMIKGNAPEQLVDQCRQCNCTCDLPVGPKGDKGDKGDSIKGERGEPGIDGTDGIDGLAGPKGERGQPGVQGEQGDQGEQGVPGKQGEPGERGKTGKTGPEGPQGEKGEQGDQGRTGPEGPEGQKGDQGDEGKKGNPGRDGLDGTDGEKGAKGEEGPQGEPGIGIKGEQGEKGDQGPQGPEGEMGPDGNDGPRGKHGLCGAPGPAGMKGERGVAGIDGADGVAGPEGQQGPRGFPGVQGMEGKRGEAGRDGAQGEQGVTGERGPRGREGVAGMKGEKGEPSNVAGPQGPEGVPGARGTRGVSGNDGLDGVQGAPGVQGPRGPRGEKGECTGIDFEEFRAKIVEIIRDLMPSECADSEPNPPQKCRLRYPIDLVFLVDGSHSIPAGDFITLKKWIIDVVETFKPSEIEIPLYLNIVQFFGDIRQEVRDTICTYDVTDNCRDLNDVRRQIAAIRKGGRGTSTWSGLAYVVDNVGATLRRDSQKVLITITDGSPSDDENLEALDSAKEIFDQMFAVGVGEDLNKNILSMLSKDEPIHVSDFSALDDVIERMTSKICHEIESHILANEDKADEIVPLPATTTTTPQPTTPEMTEAPVDEEEEIGFFPNEGSGDDEEEVIPPTDDDDLYVDGSGVGSYPESYYISNLFKEDDGY